MKSKQKHEIKPKTLNQTKNIKSKQKHEIKTKT